MRLECPHCGGAVDLRVVRGRDQVTGGELRDELVRLIAEHGPVSGRDLRVMVKRRRADVRAALVEAADAGQIRHVPLKGWKGWVIA